MINNIFAKRKTEREKSHVNEYDHLQKVISHKWFSGKSEPVGMIDNPHKWAAFTIGMTRNRVQESPGWFWMKMMSKLEYVSRIMLIIKLFFQMFCKKILRSFKIIGCWHSQLNELSSSWFLGDQHILLYVTSC